MGKRIRLPYGRRLVDDVIRVAKNQPMGSMIRDLDLSQVERLRKQIRPRLSWNILFMKAYSIVGAANPELRSSYVPFPWPHLYLHEENVCFLTIPREYQDEIWLLFARFHFPEKRSLLYLQKQFDTYKNAPLETIKQFRHQVAFSKCPFFVRRFVWWLVVMFFPRYRINNMGTFGMSLSGFRHTTGAHGSSTLGPTTTILGVDLLPKHGISKLLYTFDHRVLDGKPAFDMIEQLYQALKGPIADELEQLTADAELAKTADKDVHN